MSTCTSLLHKLSSSGLDLYAQSTLHNVSKLDLILRTNQFIDVRCKKLGDFTTFWKSSTVLEILSAWCKRL